MKNSKRCICCGKSFYAPPSSKTVTCSKECSKEYHKKLMVGKKRGIAFQESIRAVAKSRSNHSNLERGTEAAMHSPKAGRFETNSSAKRWIIIHPDYGTFEFTNLVEWVRGHIEYFDCELTDENVKRIAHGFYTAKKNMLKKANTITYKEWSILYTSPKNCEMQE